MPFFERDEDIRLNYEIFGEGDGGWVTIIGGYARPLTDYRPMAKALAERGSRVLVFDGRGVGKAECPPSFTLEDVVADIAALCVAVGANPTTLVGLGFGGATAALVAAEHSSVIKKLVLVGTPRTVKDLAVEPGGPPRDPRRFLANVMRYFSKEFVGENQMIVQGYARQMMKIYQEPDSALGATCQRATMDGFDITAALEKIAVPTLVVHGEGDRLVSPECATVISVAVRGATTEIMPGVGHLIIAEAPRKLYETIDAFAKKN